MESSGSRVAARYSVGDVTVACPSPVVRSDHSNKELAMQQVGRDTAQVMSQENVELVRALTDAANRIDIDALIALLSPDVVWEETADLPGLREVYRGRDEVRAWADELLEVIESAHNALDRVRELSGDRVFTENVLTVHGRGSGAPAELRYWALYWIKNGKIARRQVFWNGDEALEAAGLSE
jgi:ketosteroid isomerase-like protein